MRYTLPSEIPIGTERTRKCFLWFPSEIDGEWRWLEKASWTETLVREKHEWREYRVWEKNYWLDK